jgi:hypothetical protein
MFQSILEFQCEGTLKFIDFFKNINKHNWAEFVYLFLILSVTNLAVVICLILATSYVIIHFFIKFCWEIIANIINVHQQHKTGEVCNGNHTGTNGSN